LLPRLPAKVRRRFAEIMAERSITVHANSRVTKLDVGGVQVNGETSVPLDEIFWTTRAPPAPWLAGTGLALDADGFLRVGARCNRYLIRTCLRLEMCVDRQL